MRQELLKKAYAAFEKSGLDERHRESFVFGFGAGYGYGAEEACKALYQSIKTAMTGRPSFPDAETR